MRNKEASVNKIIEAAILLIESVDDHESITMRQIAAQAGVGLGLINYHFENKDKLFMKALEVKFEAIPRLFSGLLQPADDPVTGLKGFLKEASTLIMKYEKYARIAIKYDLLEGTLQTPQYLIPLLTGIFAERKNEQEIRMIAYQLILSLQVIFLRADMLSGYMGYDINKEEERNSIIDMIIKNLGIV